MKFLASVRFSLVLLVGLILFVIAGTLLEAHYENHEDAARFTYRHPLFLLLLVGLFVNILLSALKRWPWKRGHMAFLVAHLGLLMVIGGVMVKQLGGVQGEMALIEGTSGSQLLLSRTQALSIDGEIHKLGRIELEDCTIECVGLMRHSETELQLWDKGGYVQLIDYPPLPVGSEHAMPLANGWEVVAPRNPPGELPARLEAQTLYVVGNRLVARGWERVYDPGALQELWAVDGGRNGYAVAAELPDGHRLYAPLSRSIKAAMSGPAAVLLRIRAGAHAELLTLPFDASGRGLAWPILGGRHLLRFQPKVRPLPFQVRLRSGRQINYPGTANPSAYTSDLLIAGREVALSMNHVHQTREGYRFYLAAISPADASAAHEVRLLVNRDPAKRWLTYPGAILVSLGALLLYFQRCKPFSFSSS